MNGYTCIESKTAISMFASFSVGVSSSGANSFLQEQTSFSYPIQMYRKSSCTTPCIDVGISCGWGVSKMLQFYVKVSFVMGMALSGELSYM